MPAVGDVIELVHEQSYLGQQVNNVSYWQANDAASSLVNLATWYETNVVPAAKARQNDLLIHVNLRLRNVFLDAETYEEPLTGTGTQASGLGELPSFFAVSMRFDHVQGNLRPGFKRWAGENEGALVDALWAPAVVTDWEIVAALLIQPPTVANPGWVPVIVQRVCAEPNPTPGAVPSCLRYRLPLNQGELITGVPTSYEVHTQPSTQNSRKWYT